MANEPDNLVLVQLHEIRATLAEHTGEFAEVRKRFDKLDRRFEDLHAVMSHTLTLSTSNELRVRDVERRYEFSEGQQLQITGRLDDFQQRMTHRMDEFERRLAEVERKIED
jgi:chromosome segregation ATPase